MFWPNHTWLIGLSMVIYQHPIPINFGTSPTQSVFFVWHAFHPQCFCSWRFSVVRITKFHHHLNRPPALLQCHRWNCRNSPHSHAGRSLRSPASRKSRNIWKGTWLLCPCNIEQRRIRIQYNWGLSWCSGNLSATFPVALSAKSGSSETLSWLPRSPKVAERLRWWSQHR